MKKIITLLSIFLFVSLIGCATLGFFLNQKIKEVDSKKTLVSKQQSQIQSLNVNISDNNKEIESLKGVISEKGIKIKKLKKSISRYSKKIKKMNKVLEEKKKAEEKAKKEAEVAKRVAEVGEYMSDDSVENAEYGDHSANQFFLKVDFCSTEKMKMSIEDCYWGGGHIDGAYAITVSLNDGKGEFSGKYDGWVMGAFDFKGTVEIINSTTIKVVCLSNKDWGSRTYYKE